MKMDANNLELSQSLSREWERIELLAHLLIESRQGRQAANNVLERLKQVQVEVDQDRSQGKGLAGAAGILLTVLELDILACVLAPEAEPRLGWLFQNLQPGVPQPYPTPALLQELLAIGPDEASPFYAALAPSAMLRRGNLLNLEGNDPYQPLHPAPGVTARLLGRPQLCAEVPGATLVKTRAAWDDLILPPDRVAVLHEFLLWINLKSKVVHEWGGEDCGGPVALFSGPSGTGKTFAAAVIASELGWPLYRVDLGRLVSKYIGETEKNLSVIFEEAQASNAILFFDEADALFGKRSEVKDSHDRYANTQ